jgi:hypothetical protein
MAGDLLNHQHRTGPTPQMEEAILQTTTYRQNRNLMRHGRNKGTALEQVVLTQES